MSDWTHLIAILPGIFAGMLLVSRVGHFAQIFTKTGVDSDDAPQADQRLSRNQILAVVAFLTGWVALFAAIGIYIHVVKDGPAGWFWFFVGIAATPCFILPLAIYILQRDRKRRAAFSADNPSRQQSEQFYEYEITFDEAYIRSLIDRYLQQDPLTGRPFALLILFTTAAVAIWFFGLFGADSKAFAFMAFLAGPAGSFIAYRVQRQVMFSDLGYASHMGKTSIYKLSADGLEVEGPRPCHQAIWPDLITWPNILRAARFSDGTFLCGCGRVTDSFALVWLPDSALHDAHPDEVLQFIDEKMRPRTVKRLKRLSAFARTGKVAGTTLE